MENVRAEIVELCDIKTHLCMKAESLYINLSKHIYRSVLNFVVFVIRHGEFVNIILLYLFHDEDRNYSLQLKPLSLKNTEAQRGSQIIINMSSLFFPFSGSLIV